MEDCSFSMIFDHLIAITFVVEGGSEVDRVTMEDAVVDITSSENNINAG